MLLTVFTVAVETLYAMSITKIHSPAIVYVWEGGGLIVSVLDSGASGLGSSPGRGHCVVIWGKTLYSHHLASLHPGVLMDIGELIDGG